MLTIRKNQDTRMHRTPRSRTHPRRDTLRAYTTPSLAGPHNIFTHVESVV